MWKLSCVLLLIVYGLTYNTTKPKEYPVTKSIDEWKSQLSSEEFHVLREKGTERAFTGKYWDNKKEGEYFCSGCEQKLFSSKHKYKSGTGWPSFYDLAQTGAVDLISDNSHGMTRVEVVCSKCGGHLGHLFPDGPAPTGNRYCINSVSLNFKTAK